ncbi:MAG: patatin [Betaproteobacteria bacterium HGW-Betaproteobacteria-22]|nr:MAG: patatin [Betaproteobacteria bacterium HGW-Betaproteobacteria-22]
MMKSPRKPRIGLALGGGSARGWAHIGVIRALEQAGITPDFVCGTSIGALVGAVYAAGELAQFEQWALNLKISDVISYMDVSLGSGLLKGERIMDFIRRDYVDRAIEDLPIPFAAVSTSLKSGAEVWLREGSTLEAVRASIAIPGLFEPVLKEGAILVDGGLVNPVPVSLARAMGADFVIAVDLSSGVLEQKHKLHDQKELSDDKKSEWGKKLQAGLDTLVPAFERNESDLPSLLNVITSSINIMQIRITRSRMAGDPPEVIVSPHLAHVGLLDFHRAKESIAAGERAMKAMLPTLKERYDSN